MVGQGIQVRKRAHIALDGRRVLAGLLPSGVEPGPGTTGEHRRCSAVGQKFRRLESHATGATRDYNILDGVLVHSFCSFAFPDTVMPGSRQPLGNSPPSTTWPLPVTQLARSETRNRTALAMSSGWPSRPSGGVVLSRPGPSLICAHCSRVASPPGVVVRPGETLLTRTRVQAHGRQEVQVQGVLPPLVGDGQRTVVRLRATTSAPASRSWRTMAAAQPIHSLSWACRNSP